MSVQDGTNKLAPFCYLSFPLGTIQPRGWIEHDIKLSAQGLAGHLFYFYRFVKDSTWLGGETEYTALNEACPYWYNYIVPLAYSIDPKISSTLRGEMVRQATYFLDYTLASQSSDGWLGPEQGRQQRGIWARCLLLQGLINHALADEQHYKRIIAAILRFCKLVHAMLKDDLTGYLPKGDDVFDPQWFGVARAHELSLSLQWVYDSSENVEERHMIWEIMEMLWYGSRKAGRDWTLFFEGENFPQEPSVRGVASNFQHGVNVAQGLRYPAQLYRMHPSTQLRQLCFDAVSMSFEHHGTPSGTLSSDEYIGGLSPQRGAEVCCTVEMMFSLNYLFRLFGDGRLCDRVELAAFNAFPAGISTDWWSHQYVTQVNQPWAKELLLAPGEKTPFFDVCRYANVFGLEPEFPCCTVNHPTAFPKLVMEAFQRFTPNEDDDNSEFGVLHAILVAAELTLPQLNLLCQTTYPFDPLVLNYRVTVKVTTTLRIRIPGWCSQPPRVVDGPKPLPHVMQHDHEGIQVLSIRLFAGEEYQFKVELDAQPEFRRQKNGTVCVYRGPLMYAYSLASDNTSRPPRNYKDQVSDCDDVVTHRGEPPKWMERVRDHDLNPKTHWGIAIDTSHPISAEIRHDTAPPLKDGQSCWNADDTPPVVLLVKVEEIAWPTQNGTAADPSSFSVEELKRGKSFMAKFIPYGCAKLHMAEFPTVDG